MALKEIPIVDIGKIAGAVAAVLALGWTLLQVGHHYLNLGERVQVVEIREDKADEIHETTNRVLNRLTTQATAKQLKEQAARDLCRKLIAKGVAGEDDCDSGPADEEARAARAAPR